MKLHVKYSTFLIWVEDVIYYIEKRVNNHRKWFENKYFEDRRNAKG